MRISRLGPATETKSDRSEFIVRPVSCKRLKRNVWRPIGTHAGLSLSPSHVNTPKYSWILTRSMTRTNNRFQLIFI